MTEGENPSGGFAALMNKAAEVADTAREQAPYGYTTDPETGDERPKRAAGRPRKPPSVEELKSATTVNEAIPDADRAPAVVKRSRSRKGADPKPEAPEVQYRPGVIAKGMNKLYSKAGKIARVMDPEIGQAFIDISRKESDDDVTVGEAWEELAKANPRIRRFLMKLIAGGAVAQLFMAHAPVLMAVLMKPAVLKLIPFSRVIQSLAEPDDDTAPGEGGLPGGMTAGDADQMADLARQQFAKMGLSVPPEAAAQLAAMAQGIANGNGPPKAYVRNQPRRSPSRADRHGS
jgi:hypothetical protein